MIQTRLIMYSLTAAVAGFGLPGWSVGESPPDPTLSAIQNTFMDQQAEALLGHAGDVLSAHPPAWPEPEARRTALLLLDGVLHDVYAPARRPVQQFLVRRLAQMVTEIEEAKTREGMRIWKSYNHGFVVQTASVTIGFDLVRGRSVGAEGFSLADPEMSRLIDQCDVLFISHLHRDHADEWVAQRFLDQEKPVVAPAQVFASRTLHPHILHLDRVPHLKQRIPIQGGKRELGVVVYPGHQGASIENNVPLVTTPEGLTVVHLGDQSHSEDFAWIDEVGLNSRVDVMLPNCWTTDIVRAVDGFRPAVVITGHENEMGHTIDHREPYWLSYQRRQGSARFGGSQGVGYDRPLILMTWGESFHFRPPAGADGDA